MPHQIIFGKSETLPAQEIIARLDVFTGDPEQGMSWFETYFGASYLEDGKSEVYDKNSYNISDTDTLKKLFPFSLSDAAIKFLLSGESQCIFFYVDSRPPVNKVIDGITLFGPVEIEQFSYE